MFIEKFALKNTNAQYHRICVSVLTLKNLHVINISTYTRVRVFATLVFGCMENILLKNNKTLVY